MKEIRFVIVDAEGLSPYVAGLRQLEQSILYPLGDGADHFFIDHGPDYHPFFSSQGRSRFLVALRGERVAGSVAGIERAVQIGGRTHRGFYLCDMKVAPDERGHGLSGRMIRHGLLHLLRDGTLRRTHFFYGAAMRGAGGDVMRSARGLHPYRLASFGARLQLYFAEPGLLANLDLSQAPPLPKRTGAVLGPGIPTDEDGVCITAGRKDLRLASTGQPWPLIHLPLGPDAWTPTWGAHLRRCGEAILRRKLSGSACFAIDERLADQIDWLRGQGIIPGAVCSLYSLRLRPGMSSEWTHMPTSEI